MNQYYLKEWTLGESEIVGISNDPIAIENWCKKGGSVVSCDEWEKYNDS